MKKKRPNVLKTTPPVRWIIETRDILYTEKRNPMVALTRKYKVKVVKLITQINLKQITNRTNRRGLERPKHKKTESSEVLLRTGK